MFNLLRANRAAKNSQPRKLGYLAGANDLPHSRQDDLDRGVISPQNGHTLCDAKPWARSLNGSMRLRMDALILMILLRTASRNSSKLVPIRDPAFSRLSSLHIENDTSRMLLLCKIAHPVGKLAEPGRFHKNGGAAKVSNVDQLSARRSAILTSERSTASLFQVSELSQPSEVFSS
jgi:hypothetical protein